MAVDPVEALVQELLEGGAVDRGTWEARVHTAWAQSRDGRAMLYLRIHERGPEEVLAFTARSLEQAVGRVPVEEPATARCFAVARAWIRGEAVTASALLAVEGEARRARYAFNGPVPDQPAYGAARAVECLLRVLGTVQTAREGWRDPPPEERMEWCAIADDAWEAMAWAEFGLQGESDEGRAARIREGLAP